MPERAGSSLKGRRLLIVEDDYLIASDLANALQDLGIEILGPAGSVEAALELVERDGERLDGAVLDINLRDQRVYPVAKALATRGVPFVFATGYDAAAIPQAYAAAPRCEKPVDKMQVVSWLSDVATSK